jgi:hypothetical protein
MGSPQRFSKKKVRLSKETSLATEGMQEAASNPVVKSMSAANDAKQHVRSAYNNSGTHPTNPVLSSSNQANGAIGVSAPIGDTGGMAEPGVRPEDPLPTSIHFAAFKAGKHETHDPIAYSSDINAIRHMLANTAEQRITPHARYAEAMKMGHKVGGSGLKSMCDEMQKTLGMAAHGNQLLTQSLLSDPAEVNHDIPLESGVTRLSGYIAPYSGGNSDFMSSKAYKADPTMPGILNLLRDRNQPFRRDYVPLTPLQYGLMDYLHPSEMNHPPVYGTPDGRLFLNPEHANRHIASNPGIIKFNGRLHNPWHHIMDRVGTYTGVDHIINAIARDSELHKAEGGSDEIMSTLGSGRISDVGVDKFKSLLKAEPKRFTRLLDILSDHLGSSDPSLVASSSGGVTPRNPHPAGFGQAVIRENTPLSWSLGSSNPDKLTETAARIHNLWSNLTDRPNRLHLRVGSYMPNNVKEASDLGFQSAHGYDPTLGDYHDGSFTPVSSEPVSSVNVSQIMTPTVLAHEMAHHAETMIPGVGRAVMEHAFANSGGEPEHAEEYGFGGFKWNTLRTDWTDSPVISKYAKRINPGRLLFTAPWNNGVRRLNNFPGSSEYLSSMTEEFFARPVKMCREHPLVARMVLGLMNGALRNVR